MRRPRRIGAARWGFGLCTLGLLVMLPFAARPAAVDEPGKITIELNRLEETEGNCRVYLVFTNPGAASYTTFKLDLILFDRSGVITRRLAVEAAPLRPEKTSVKLFDVSATNCAAIGSILVNDVIACHDEKGDASDCVDRLVTRSKLDVALMK
jgi:hypothetical protein